MELTWIVILPPVAVFAIALYTQNVLYALLSGVLTAAYIAARFNIIAAATLVLHKFLEETSLLDFWKHSGAYDHAYTLGFLLCLGIIIEFMTRSGGLIAYGTLVRSWIHTKRQAEGISLVIAPLFFLDDYLNNLVGGSIVRPLFDHFGLARAKLAYVLNAISSSQCVLVPASSWLAFIVMQLQASGISCNAGSAPLVLADAYTVYVHTLPYLFYPILSIASAWFIVGRGISYGPMRAEEEQPVPYNNNPTTNIISPSTPNITLSSFFVPLITFLVGIPAMLLITGGWHPWHQTMTWCQALTNTDALFAALWWASFMAFGVTFLFFLMTAQATLQELIRWSWSGIVSMKSSIMLLTLAWMFASLLKHDVPAGAYIAHHVIRHAPPGIIPALCFVTATCITAIVGSSWGMISIMLPLALPLITSGTVGPALPVALPLLLPVLGAILSGATSGPHFSPITDAAIISSATAGISPMLHIRTLAPYCIPAFVSALVGFIVVTRITLTASTLAGLIIALLCLTGGMLTVLNKYQA